MMSHIQAQDHQVKAVIQEGPQVPIVTKSEAHQGLH